MDSLLKFLYKFYEVPENWNGSKINKWYKSILNNREPGTFRVDTLSPFAYFFGDMRKNKSGEHEIDIYRKKVYLVDDVVKFTTSYFNVSLNNSSDTNKNDNPDEYIITFVISNDKIIFRYIGFFSNTDYSETEYVVNENINYKTLLSKGLETYGYNSVFGGSSRKNFRRNFNKKSQRKSNKKSKKSGKKSNKRKNNRFKYIII